jgi:hypothetical protein
MHKIYCESGSLELQRCWNNVDLYTFSILFLHIKIRILVSLFSYGFVVIIRSTEVEEVLTFDIDC